jgi:N-acetylglucosamine malate deacetylase 1
LHRCQRRGLLGSCFIVVLNQIVAKSAMLDILVIAPHPDDAELGMGGAIMRFLEDGWRVGIVELTDGEPTPHGSREIRARETAAASKLLGIEWRENLALPNRRLEATLEAREKLAVVIRQTRPRWLFAPYWIDSHPDHLAATELAEAARFWAKLTKTDMPGEPHHPERIFYYFGVHIKLVVPPAFVLDISGYWDRKQAAIECYQSQFAVGRSAQPPSLIERWRHQAAYWGGTIGAAYGEPFASREPLGLATMIGVK